MEAGYAKNGMPPIGQGLRQEHAPRQRKRGRVEIRAEGVQSTEPKAERSQGKQM